MGSLMTSDLSLDCRLPSKLTDEFVARISRTYGESEKISKLKAYIQGMQDERKKIDGFPGDLPLSAGLMDEAIVKLKGVLAQCKRSNVKPVLEEFIPLKSTSAHENGDTFGATKEKDINTSTDKRDWMSSVQLGNSDNRNSCPNIDLSSNTLGLKLDNNDKKKSQEEMQMTDDLFHIGEKKAVGKAFVPFKGCSNFLVMTVGKEDKDELPIVPRLSLCTPEVEISREDINHNGFSSKSSSSRSGSSSATNSQSQTARKQRRCWSPELHRRFVDALHQLGGAQVATPKQIRELMQVDGLTNDEVKSHLQKYRLHTRKADATRNNSTIHPGIWVSQEQCDESSKVSNSQSGSPQGPLQLAGSSWGTSMTTGGDNMEDEDDEKTESHSWKSHINLSG